MNATSAEELAKLKEEIRRLLDELEKSESPGVFKALVALALGWEVDPDQFRHLLVEAGLRASRASEIKAVLLCPELAAEFVNGPLSWKTALERARLDGTAPEDVAAAGFVRQLIKYGHLLGSANSIGNWALDRHSGGIHRFKKGAHTLEVRVFIPDLARPQL